MYTSIRPFVILTLSLLLSSWCLSQPDLSRWSVDGLKFGLERQTLEDKRPAQDVESFLLPGHPTVLVGDKTFVVYVNDKAEVLQGESIELDGVELVRRGMDEDVAVHSLSVHGFEKVAEKVVHTHDSATDYRVVKYMSPSQPAIYIFPRLSDFKLEMVALDGPINPSIYADLK